MADYYPLFLVACFAFFLVMDQVAAYRPRRMPLVGRWATNYFLYLCGFAVHYGLAYVGAVLVGVVAEQRIGLFQHVEAELVTMAVVAFLAFDLFKYGFHRLMHRLPWLWRIHRVHHSDRDFDFTTGIRFHPVETLLEIMVNWLVILVLGIPLEAMLLYVFVLAFVNYLVHSNIRLPDVVERWVGLLLITPNLHRSHHAVDRAVHDTNYGVVLSVWDRLFGTLHREWNQDELETGIVAYSKPEELSFSRLLWMPLAKKP